MPTPMILFLVAVGFLVLLGAGYFLLGQHEASKEQREYFRRENEKARSSATSDIDS